MLSPQIQSQESSGQVSLLRETQESAGLFKKKSAARPGGFAALLQGLLSAGKAGAAEGSPGRALAGTGRNQAADPSGSGGLENPEKGAAAEPSRSRRRLENGSAETRARTAGNAADAGGAAKGGTELRTAGAEAAILSELKAAVIPQHSGTASAEAKAKNAQAAEAAQAQKNEAQITRRRTVPDGAHQEIAAAAAGSQAVAPGSTRVAGGKSEALRGEAGMDPDSKVEGKKRDRRKDRLELEVHDLRTRGQEHMAQGLEEANQEPAGKIPETELVVELRSENGERRAGGGSDAAGKAPSFQDALAREIREGAGADIVRHASLVLKDGGEGLIRLNLKPESLGAVKIRLEMADNKIAGSIVVESEEALKAFEKEIRSLEQAFVDGGFDGASLELSVAADGAGDRRNREDGGGPKPFYSERLAAADYDAAAADIAATDSYRYGGAEAAVDMLA